MTEEKVLYLVKKLEKNIKKEIFNIFDYMFFDCEDDRNYEYEVAYSLNCGGDTDKCKPTFYVYYGDYREKDENKFECSDGAAARYKSDVNFIEAHCYIGAKDREEHRDKDNSKIAGYVLARLMHYSKKYDRKIKKQETVNEPTTN